MKALPITNEGAATCYYSSGSGAESTPTPSLVTRLLRKHGYWLSLFFYVFVLLLIGLFNSKSFWRQVRDCMRIPSTA
ncbi:hypothetical protein EB796_001437 [Bugula neritina]|uniref:Uncharacterized protein n=1 Tax=Bugula neritina TaxID=10212 RepID=A0A7J7KQ82_BUGNE|nr:hypothetical protein EB796_001437 [Bugula neritina]